MVLKQKVSNGSDNMTGITLTPLTPDDRERFITDNREAFSYGTLQGFGKKG